MSVVITFATICVIVFPKSLFPFLRLRILGKKGPWTLELKTFMIKLTMKKDSTYTCLENKNLALSILEKKVSVILSSLRAMSNLRIMIKIFIR